jgi:N-methylhydantoinase A
VRAGIDVGGTFTDLAGVVDGTLVVVKVPSTSDQSVGFANALRALDARPDEVLHGTTVATNAVLERKGARLAFVATEGFRHLMHLARQDRPSLYDLRARRPDPLVEAGLCVAAPERVDQNGGVLRPLDTEGLSSRLTELRGRVDAVAVTLLHSYANDDHEQAVARVIADALPGAAVSLSTRVLPEFREYERASTTAMNAYVQPVVTAYLSRLDRATEGGLGIAWSGGGIRGLRASIERPVNLLLSGPAAGVIGAAWWAQRCGVADAVTVDMGGTSTDVSIVLDGSPTYAEEARLDGLPFRTPCVDVISVGAGGGSVAWLDEGGALRVGPRSAGADPGPASYGRGGTEPTVTDAHVLAGHLGESGLAGGSVRLDAGAARDAISRLAAAASISLERTASGVLEVARATMTRAIRSLTIERGMDVRGFALVAGGGAGPLHAAELASELGITSVLVPPHPGALAAFGLLAARRRADASLSHPMLASAESDAEAGKILASLAEAASAELASEGVREAVVELEADCRYAGQSYEIRLPAGDGAEAIVDAFHRAHRQRFGFARPDANVELVTFRAAALGPQPDVELSAPRVREMRPSRRRVGGEAVEVIGREAMSYGSTFDGPLIIEELDATTWVPPGWACTVHESGSLLMRAGP